MIDRYRLQQLAANEGAFYALEAIEAAGGEE